MVFDRLKKMMLSSQAPDTDSFIQRLPSLVIGEGMLNSGNIAQIRFAIQNLSNEGSVIEIGSYGGLSTNLIIHLLKKHHKNNPLFNCDPWIYEGQKDRFGIVDAHIDGRADILRSDYAIYMKNAFVQATQLLHSNNLPHTFHTYSDLFFKKWQNNETDTDLFGRTVTLGGPIGFAYIDGDHSYDAVLNDFLNVSTDLIKNGYILMDDSADHLNFGSSQIMQKIKQDKRYRIVSKNPNYLIQKIV